MPQRYKENVYLPNMAATLKEKNKVLMNDEELMRDKPLIIKGQSSIHRFHRDFGGVFTCMNIYIYIIYYIFDELMNIIYNIIYNLLNISHSSFSHQISSKTYFDEIPP